MYDNAKVNTIKVGRYYVYDISLEKYSVTAVMSSFSVIKLTGFLLNDVIYDVLLSDAHILL